MRICNAHSHINSHTQNHTVELNMTYIASLEVAVFHDVLLSEIFKIWMQQRYLRSYALTWIIC
jgi:hypothetical protein